MKEGKSTERAGGNPDQLQEMQENFSEELVFDLRAEGWA